MKQALLTKTGGFIKGICHPAGDVSLLHEAGIGWVRLDVPYPTEDSYAPFLQRIADYHAQSIRAILISPYPARFIQDGCDPTTPEGLLTVERICAQMAADFAPYQPCWQATNEMHIVHFRVPLTEMQAVDFLAASIRGLRRGDPDAAIGHNSLDESWQEKALLVEQKCGGTDYIGMDLYAGTWLPGDESTYMLKIDQFHALLNKPVILMEFGFTSQGACMEEDGSDVAMLLKAWGFNGLDDVRSRVEEFITKLPPQMQAIAEKASPAERLHAIRPEFFSHLLKKWPTPTAIPHSELGQVAFYGKLLPKLLAHPHLAGAVIYCMKDSERCFLCGAEDCPLETTWGLLRLDGSTKLAYEVVKSVFSNEANAV